MRIEDFSSDPLRFASLIAHQLQTPLSSIGQALKIVLGEYTGPLLPQQRGSLETASLRCEQAMTSVRRMLAIIKAQEERSTEPHPALLTAVARQLHAQYSREAAERGLFLDLDLPEGPVYVRIEESALTEALIALLNNAVKYTPERGKIRLAVEHGGRPDQIRLSVSDSGVGIPEGQREKIFEPFFRATTARDSSRPGVGLGLTFVKSVVTAAGGSVEVGTADLGGAEFVLNLPLAEAPAAGESEREKQPSLRVVIVGGVTAGPKAAAKIIRLMPDADVTVVDKGNVMSYAGCGLPYYVAGEVRDQKHLISSPAGVERDPVFFRSVKNVHVMNYTEAVEIDRIEKRICVRDLSSGRESWLGYDKLLLATGSSPSVPESLRTSLKNVFTLQGVRDAEGIKIALAGTRARDVVIVGGGLLGIEMTESLVRRGARVTVIEQLPGILKILDADMAFLVERHLEAHGVRILTGTTATGLEGRDAVSGVVTDRGTCPADVVILTTGARPNTDLARRAGLEIGRTSAIVVDEFMRTSDPDIYAAGDCVKQFHRVGKRPCYFPLGSTASKQARVAAVNICGGSDRFPGILGSCICKLFDYCAARTGLGESEARELGYDVVTVLAPGPDKDHYMPNARLLLMKLIVDRTSRRLLGAQATGPGAADKRIDVAGMAIGAEMTVDELANADLCYAPPYSTAMDNIITAANVARNKLDGYMPGITPTETYEKLRRGDDFIFLDVRTPEEYDRVRLPGARLIPLATLRHRHASLPKESEIIVFSSISLRGYEAGLILAAAGFSRVRVMEGGMAMWPFEKLE